MSDPANAPMPTDGRSHQAPTRPGSAGVMGGTFDPIHLGHLAVAEEAREALGLETILFVPAGLPPHKLEGAAASAEDRVTMVRLAIAGNPAFELSRVDVDRPGPSYTADTIALLGDARLGTGVEPDLTLIMSTETLAGLPSWHQPLRLVRQCRIAVVPREGHAAPSDAWLTEHFPGLEHRFDLLAGPRLGISSTAIRDRVASGRSIRYLVPEAVERHIADHHLYARANRAD
ncbi:MAG: nicotinate-nucleotide adenylyltransferase [Chloroflexota bacterium]